MGQIFCLKEDAPQTVVGVRLESMQLSGEESKSNRGPPDLISDSKRRPRNATYGEGQRGGDDAPY